jgi:hypothetical protein
MELLFQIDALNELGADDDTLLGSFAFRVHRELRRATAKKRSLWNEGFNSFVTKQFEVQSATFSELN